MWFPSASALHVILSPTRVVVVRKRALWPHKVISRTSLECAPAVGAMRWQPALEVLTQFLTQQKDKPTVHVLVSGPWVRWQVLPWQEEITHPSELATYAAARFVQTYGDVAKTWRVDVPVQAPHTAVPVCALDQELVVGLQKSCDGVGAKLVQVSPYFSHVFDQCKHALPRTTLWLAVQQDTHITLGLVSGTQWLALQTQAMHADWRAQLPSWMAQILISVGGVQGQVPLYLLHHEHPPALQPISRVGA